MADRQQAPPRSNGARPRHIDKDIHIDYKEIETLRKFLTASHKIMSRKRSGATAQEQKAVKLAVKRARFMGLLPYSGI